MPKLYSTHFLIFCVKLAFYIFSMRLQFSKSKLEWIRIISRIEEIISFSVWRMRVWDIESFFLIFSIWRAVLQSNRIYFICCIFRQIDKAEFTLIWFDWVWIRDLQDVDVFVVIGRPRPYPIPGLRWLRLTEAWF